MPEISHHICSSVSEIEDAVAAINTAGTYGAIGILPGTYNLKSPYRKELEIDPATATVPSGATEMEDRYAIYIDTPNVTIYAVQPGTVVLQGESTAILKSSESTSSEYRVFRGGMIHLTANADQFTIRDIELDGNVAVSETFAVGDDCHADTTDGVDCWDHSHRAIHSLSPNARIRSCRIHQWAGEMIYGGSGTSTCKLEISGDSRLYDNQVAAIAGNFQLRCYGNELYDLYRVSYGSQQYTAFWTDNYIHDCDIGIDVIGPLTADLPADGWWNNIQRNIFERVGSATGGAISLTDSGGSYSPAQNIGILNNVFRDCTTAITVNAGSPEKVFILHNTFVGDKATGLTGIKGLGGAFVDSLVRDNTFLLTQDAIDNSRTLAAADLNTGAHEVRFIDNYYDNVTPPHGTNSTALVFRRERYKDCTPHATHQSLTDDGSPTDVTIAGGTTGVFAVQFTPTPGGSGPLYLRLLTVDGMSDPLYPDGTELRLQGYADDIATDETAFLIDGRGCQLKNGWPVLLQSTNDYVLLRYNATLELWVEIERSTPRANATFKLADHGHAADRPDFASIEALTISMVNVIDAALWGWQYVSTDSGTEKVEVYTDSGWQEVWAA